MPQLTARERIARLTRSFDEQDAGLVAGDPLGFPDYPAQVDRARDDTGLREACVWGWADIEGVRCALVVGDFSFLGGSMGVAVGEKVVGVVDDARRKSAAVVTVTSSGGARMQEGMAALVQMARTAEARRSHAAAGLGHISVLTSPTTGGVYASFASLADVILAEPEATLGFAGPRVVAELAGVSPDARVHTAEFAFEHGLVDAVVDATDQREVLGRVLAALQPTSERFPGKETSASRTFPTPEAPPSAWERLELVREPSRPKAPFVLDRLVVNAFTLRGDRTGAPDDERVDVRLGDVRGINCVAIGLDASGDGRIRPQGFRKAIRAIGLAGRIGLPVVTIVDTRGADPLPSSEGHGVASAIAQTFDTLLGCSSPTLAVLIGEGGSGGALAFSVTDRVVAWEHAVFSVIAPEGAATILYRDATKAPELAEQLKITTPDLVELGIVDTVVPEPPGGAHTDPMGATQHLCDVVAGELSELTGKRDKPRLRRRQRRWRSLTDRYIQQA